MGCPQVNVGKGFYLPELIARYVAGPFIEDNPTVDVSEIRPRLGKPRGGTLTIVVVDGSAGLTERAPLALLDAGKKPTSSWRSCWQGDLVLSMMARKKRNLTRCLPQKTVG